jgi:hypothetical protein
MIERLLMQQFAAGANVLFRRVCASEFTRRGGRRRIVALRPKSAQ